MFEIPCEPRRVKEVFAVAQRMKRGSFDEAGYRVKLLAEQAHVAAHTDVALDTEVTDHHRLVRINRGKWTLRVVNLEDCAVWPAMGKRTWARGPVPKVAEAL